MTQLEAIAEIDYTYFMLKQIAQVYSNRPKDPMSELVSDACGYTSHILKDTKELIERIIELKKKFGYDYSYDEQQLTELLKLTGA